MSEAAMRYYVEVAVGKSWVRQPGNYKSNFEAILGAKANDRYPYRIKKEPGTVTAKEGEP